MGSDISRDRIIELAREQEERRKGIKKENRSTNINSSASSTSGNTTTEHKKTKVVERKRTKSKQVNAFRLVLYTFRADPAYPEQVTVLQDQLIYTAEDCGDGWSV